MHPTDRCHDMYWPYIIFTGVFQPSFVLVCSSGFKAKRFHASLVLSNELIAFSALLAVEEKTLVSGLLLVQAHATRLWFGWGLGRF